MEQNTDAVVELVKLGAEQQPIGECAVAETYQGFKEQLRKVVWQAVNHTIEKAGVFSFDVQHDIESLHDETQALYGLRQFEKEDLEDLFLLLIFQFDGPNGFKNPFFGTLSRFVVVLPYHNGAGMYEVYNVEQLFADIVTVEAPLFLGNGVSTVIEVSDFLKCPTALKRLQEAVEWLQQYLIFVELSKPFD